MYFRDVYVRHIFYHEIKDTPRHHRRHRGLLLGSGQSDIAQLARLGGMVFGNIYLRGGGINPWERFKLYQYRRRLERLKKRSKSSPAAKTTAAALRCIKKQLRAPIRLL